MSTKGMCWILPPTTCVFDALVDRYSYLSTLQAANGPFFGSSCSNWSRERERHASALHASFFQQFFKLLAFIFARKICCLLQPNQANEWNKTGRSCLSTTSGQNIISIHISIGKHAKETFSDHFRLLSANSIQLNAFYSVSICRFRLVPVFTSFTQLSVTNLNSDTSFACPSLIRCFWSLFDSASMLNFTTGDRERERVDLV